MTGDPLKRLHEMLEAESVEYDGPLPFVGGAVGYLSYDLCQLTEGARLHKPDDAGLPDLEFGFYDAAVVCDNLDAKVWLVSCGATESDCKASLGRLRKRLKKGIAGTVEEGEDARPCIKSNYTRQEYVKAVNRVKEYIREGDVYQVNLSQRFTAMLKSNGWSLYKRLRRINPAPFSAYLRFGDADVMCSSPERFLRVQVDMIETRPIKGTRPRGIDKGKDAKFASELLSSGKDKAEHVMIVDLERNDLGKVCEYGTVAVTEFEALESYPTVHHLVSTVSGKLRKDVRLVDCISACFPGGSITGAPKVRAIEIIDEIEPVRRGLYTGSIGYLGYDGKMDLNIVIRTIIYRRGRAFFNVGGGIVSDSDPDAEYDETIDKARALFESLKAEGYGMKTNVNGKLADENDAAISPLDYGLLYGYGLFETMRAEKGRVFRLNRHIARLRAAAKTIDIPMPWSDDELGKMVEETIQANRLDDAYIRLTVTRGVGEPRLDFSDDAKPTIIIVARKLPPDKTAATKLAVSKGFSAYSKDVRTGIKSTNYLVSALAKAEAKELKVDDVILLNENGRVTECSTANIFLVSKGKLITPSIESGILPGITREAVIELARKLNIAVEEREVLPSELASSQEIFKTSSIAGIVPVTEVDGKPVGDGRPGRITLEIRRKYLELIIQELETAA